jgi:hypothetical protein
MAIEKIIEKKKKLYEKRSALDKQIADAEKKLIAGAKADIKATGPAKKPAIRKPAKPRVKSLPKTKH